jgi:uncharacterized protein YjbI with pentapeptide repeats
VAYQTVWSYANLSNANSSAVDLSGAELQYADLSGANLTQTSFGQANLTGADMSGATLTGTYWSDTICPDGTISDNDGDTCANNMTPAD